MLKTNRVVLAVVFLFIFIGSSSVMAQNVRTTKSGYLASTSRKLLDKAMEYVAEKDLKALQKLMDTNLVFMLKGGLKVYIVDTKIFSGEVKIRPAGETIEVWTVMEAVGN